jgi:glycerol-3-phosphate O-acyltransferase
MNSDPSNTSPPGSRDKQSALKNDSDQPVLRDQQTAVNRETDFSANPSGSMRLSERIEPSMGEMPELPANDEHGKVIARFEQANDLQRADNAWQPRPPQRSWFFKLMRRWVKPLIKAQLVPEKKEAPPFDLHQPVLYVLEHAGLANLLILDIACEDAGWPSPMQMLPLKHKERGFFALSKRAGGWFGRARVSDRQDRLERLLVDLQTELGQRVQLVPVSVFVGRAPDRTSGWFKVLFSDDWVVVGRLRRLLGVIFNGRSTLVQFAEPVQLEQLRDETDNSSVQNLKGDARKLSRLLGVHFRRIRAAAVGPDLSHRRILMDAVTSSSAVQTAIKAHVLKERVSFEVAEAKAQAFFWEIAADYAHPVIRSLSFMLTWFWNQIYSGVKINHFDSLQKVAPGREVVYVPCHRSHIDYLLLSYLLYSNGIVVPHIAAGVNLNLPVVGPILRRGGAFFMRRSFKASPLYAAVFSAYISELIAQGFPLEYFIEGGRSRSGRTMPARAGLLSMTVKSYLSNPQRPVVFQPVYIGYEKVIEGKSYLGELSGRVKKKESIWGLLKSFRVLKENFGAVAVNFGEPIELNDLLAKHEPNWRAEGFSAEARPSWYPGVIDELSDQVLININRAADVNAISLLALALLGTPKHAMDEADLLRTLDLAKGLIKAIPYSDRVTMTEKSAQEIIAHGESMKWIRRIKHPLGDVLTSDGDEGVLISYYRNNILHLFATVSWVACCFINIRRLSRAGVNSLGQLFYPLIKSELYLPWTPEQFGEQIEATVRYLVSIKVLNEDVDSQSVCRPSEGSEAQFSLNVLAKGLLQTFQRYYIVISVLNRYGPKTLSASELEKHTSLTAQRIALVQETSGPEFFDPNLIKNCVQMMRETGVVWSDENSKLDFGDQLKRLDDDARVILSRELRAAIIKSTQLPLASVLPAPSALPVAAQPEASSTEKTKD